MRGSTVSQNSFSFNSRSDVDILSGPRPGIELSSGPRPETEVSSGPRPRIELSSGPRPGIEFSSGSRPGTELETEELLSPAELVSNSSSRPEKKAVFELPVILWSDEDGTKF